MKMSSTLNTESGFVIGQRAQIQSITDVSRGSIKRKKTLDDAPSFNAFCIPEEEVAVATKQLVVANHDALYHAILFLPHHPFVTTSDAAVIRS